MRVETLGSGEPEVAVVGGIHGDEPCGPAAIDALLAADLDVKRPVKLIVANEAAAEAGVRYVEEDLNRAFPGSPEADSHEGRLAHELLGELRDCAVLSLHSTQSYAAPFALVDETDGFARSICPYFSVEALIETAAYSGGRLISYPTVVEMECGLQRSVGAAINAERLTREFLVATGVLDGDGDPRAEMPVFRLVQQLPKPQGEVYEVYAENFERVSEGAPFAAVDGEPIVADMPFYPVLLSAYGYENEFGYAADLVGRLDGAS